MQDKKSAITVKNIAQALGVTLVLLCAVLFLAPTGVLWPLGYGLYFVLGQAGYWFLLPFLVLLGAVLTFRGSLKRCFIGWNVYAGFFLFLAGLATLLSHLAFAGAENAEYANFVRVIDVYRARESAGGLFFSDKIGGGIAGFYLSSFALRGGSALLWTLAILFIALGVMLAFFPLWKMLFVSIRRQIKTSAAKRSAARETARIKAEAEAFSLREKEEGPLDVMPLSPEAKPSEIPAEKPLIAPAKPEEETPVYSRADVYGEKPASPIPSAVAPTPAQQNHPFVSPNEMAHSGLQEAVFVPDEKEAENYEASRKAPVLGTTVVNSAADDGFHSNEIPTPNANHSSPSEEKEEASAPARFNEIPTPASTPVKPAEPSLAYSPAPSLAPTPSASQPSPSFIVKPAPAALKAASAPQATPKVEATPHYEDNEIHPTPLKTEPEPLKLDGAGLDEESAPTPQASPTSTFANASPASSAVAPTLIAPDAPVSSGKSTSQATSVFSVPPAAPAAISSAPVSPLDQCNQPKAQTLPSYHFPSLDLLRTYPANANQAQMELECQTRAATINQAFSDLGAGAHVVSYTIGPSVTRFDIQCDKDVSVSSLSRYVQDISVRLNGVPTRYEEVVRGKTTSGLEIANSSTTIVSLKEVVNALPKGDKYNLYIPFGKSISGDYISADLSEFPHLLVSGSTGSGKSIFMHGLIMSLIMRNRPEDLKLVVVDPKRVEMGKYKDLPHLLCPIIKEPSQAKVCFRKLIDEMERRYTLFELSGVSNIRQFNSEYAPEAGFAKLPFIVVVVDEYADLVDTCKDIGEGVVRLAQKARAAGIHLVIATQRPSVQVITGVIKANLPVRVALSVSSAIDSMTILGQGGAEDLAGHGDMLVDCSLVARNGFTRCQGCFVDNKEVKAVVDDIKAQENVVYDPNFLDLVDHDAEARAAAATAPAIDKAELKAKGDDDLYETIKADIMNQEYTSISRIQRSYGVGFPRAGKIFARLQAEEVVAQQPDTASSSKGCRVLKHENPAPSANAGSSDQASLSLTPNSPYPPGANGGSNP